MSTRACNPVDKTLTSSIDTGTEQLPVPFAVVKAFQRVDPVWVLLVRAQR